MFETAIALKHIKSRRRQTALSMGAIGLAVAIIIVLRSLMNGSLDTFFSIFFELAPHVLVTPKDGEECIYLYQTLIENIWAIPGVVAVSPALSGSASLSHEDKVENVALTGIVPSEMNKVTRIGDRYMVLGALDSVLAGRKVVLGTTTAEKLEVKLGDSVKASYPDSEPMNLVIGGIFDTGVEEWDESAFVSLDTGRAFLGEGDVVTYIDIHLEDPEESDIVADRISAWGYKAESWRDLFPEFERTVEIESLSNDLILMLVLLIASFGIANVMNMLVLEKTREIGMLMAMGANPAMIRRLFLIESGILGLIGGISGSLFGYVVSAYFHSLHVTVTAATAPQPITLKFLVSPVDMVAFPILALILAMLAGVYPAHKASKLDPVVALKG